ncbi:MAG: hypothetical protein SFX73_32285 [Kofleriaceae bacterium]|nr:hypothetical protein [Kofleriaceae bacterium]
MHRVAVFIALLGLASCADEVRCDLDGCPAGEFCVRNGSDVQGQGPTFSRPAPSTCTGEPSCSCIEAGVALGESPGLAFCLAEGGCEMTSVVTLVTCPGG